LPAATLLFLFAKYYQFIQGLSASSWILDGMRIGAMVIILQSVGSLFSPYRKKVTGWLYALSGALLLTLLPRWEPLIILGGGILSVLLLKKYPDFRLKLQSVSVLLALFWTHFKAGALVFGTGLAIVPILEREVVTKYHWLTQKEFLDALVFGQITPGPVTTLSSFIGYQVAEGFGSLIATFGMYLPGALMILLFLPRIRSSIENKSWLVDFQRGAVPTVIGCLMAASFGLLSGVLVDPVLRATFFVLLLIQIVWVFPAWLVILLGSCLQPILCFVVDSIL
ncbi:MAG: chromate transporter, partial [Proteobacteria bacterium]|nr:chromate transporter [Pseudomonadota bacterium]